MFRLRAALALSAAFFSLVACTSDKTETSADKPPAETLPAGDTLVKDSAAAMRAIKTTQFLIEADGEIAGLSLRRAEGTLTKEGSAKGTAQIEQSGQPVELEFVIVGDKIYLKGPTGGFQALPLTLAASVYDPSAILDPSRGIAKVLGSATGATTEAKEAVDGKDAWRVAATSTGPDLKGLIPGVTGSIPAKLWIADADKRLLKSTFTLPGGTVTVTFQKFDEPVTISAP
ncbi:LppX_LprAFG lipoprotein [Paractinoplanes lichenicola]|uniref:LppX_LprAFG lipoprotein n=1 Tax=Paractinoplanes lichenicola TaxID=2802976 RepID=A0ABS1W4L5_9ACTN|nr:LppX_LprAFG lipoprotein [Actinoplanes lichenicola]MBL7261627.1 LppX_LprAFG lipoprotein [Actinoplanes lichenicola]